MKRLFFLSINKSPLPLPASADICSSAKSSCQHGELPPPRPTVPSACSDLHLLCFPWVVLVRSPAQTWQQCQGGLCPEMLFPSRCYLPSPSPRAAGAARCLNQQVCSTRRLLPGGQVPTLFLKFFFIPVAELNIPSGSCLRLAAPCSACNCLLSAGVGSAQLPSAPDSLPFPMCAPTGTGRRELKPFKPFFLPGLWPLFNGHCLLMG